MESLPCFESVMLDIIELSKDINFNFWPSTLLGILRIGQWEYLTNLENLSTLRRVLAIWEIHMACYLWL